jgi:hypothetical protein
MKKEFVDDDLFHIWMENGILNVVYKIKRLDLANSKRAVETRLNLDLVKSYPTYVDVSSIRSVTKEARDYMSSDIAIKNVSASAFLAGSVISKLMATFFLSYNKPNVPIKIFTDRNEALKWLGQFNKETL